MTERNPLIWGPTFVNQSFRNAPRTLQVSAHQVLSKAFLREVKEVFPCQELLVNVIVIATMQHAEIELVRMGPEVEQEKDHLLEVVSITLPSRPHSSRVILSLCLL
ncbi:hypothetical protein EON65_14290 [archaeon]|nr:MAG: hypothetical protein EON65_14290 [archaeon]